MRAVSIFMVMAFHKLGPITGMLPNGWLGVNVFFVISGFLITSLLLKEHAQSGTINLRSFYTRRFLRLMPAYWVWLVVLLLVHPAANGRMGQAFFSALFYMSDYDLALYWGNILGSGYEGTWSLSVEEKFYFLWPAIVLFLGMRSGYAAIVAIVACECFKVWLCYSHATPLRLLGAFDTHVDELMIGCLAAHLMSQKKVRSALSNFKGANICSLTLVAAIAFIWCAIQHPGKLAQPAEMSLFFAGVMPMLCALVALFIMLGAAQERLWLARILSLRPLVWMGVLSYSLYLWHPLVVERVSVWATHITHNSIKNELLTFAACLIVAALSYYLIERPFLKLKKRFEFKGVPPTKFPVEPLNAYELSRTQSRL